MTDQKTPNINEQEAFIPPYYMLILALVGLVVAAGVLLTQPTFTVVGWGALGIGALALVAWVLMAPDQAKAILTGRTARYGGTSLVISVLFIVALIAIYVFIRGREWRLDLTEKDTFSLTTESQQAVAGLGIDPNVPPVKILAFYNSVQAGQRDQDVLLFKDYEAKSAGKVTYEFIDPDRNPTQAELYKITRAGVIAVVAMKDDGTSDAENAQLVNYLNQDDLTNAILRVASQGDFRAYFLNVDGGLQLTDTGAAGMSMLNDSLVNRYDWKTKQVSLFELMSPQSEDKLNDPATDGEVLVIPGGEKPLTDDEMQFIADYVNKGGSLIIYAAPNISATANDSGETSVSNTQPLALSDNLSQYLWDNFGLRFVNNVVADPKLAIQTPLVPVAIDFSTTHYVTQSIAEGSGVVFELPHSIEIAPTLPENVTVEELARSGADSFAKTDIQALLQQTDQQIQAAEGDPKGPLVLAAAAENSATGARVVLFGSASVPANNFALGSGIANLDVAFNSMIWTTRFNDYFSTVNIQSAPKPQDQPVLATDDTLRGIQALTLFLLPFGILGIGLLVWWNNRERARAR